MPDDNQKFKSMPFDEAVNFFKEKLNMPSEHWDDLWRDQHAKGFMVAGAMKADLLMDLRGAVEKAISGGSTIDDFRKEFDDIVAKRGWVYKGGRNWRTKVIYDTNLRQAYNAGRYKQMSDPDVTALRPYLQYRHGDSRKPRPQHLAWDGLVLRHDDPFWNTHKPQNGFGCKCRVVTISERDLAKLGKSGPDTAPEIETVDYKNPQTGKIEKVPKGIDPGFDYDVGRAAYGQKLSQRVMDSWKAKGKDAWERLTPGSFFTENRPAIIPMDTPKAKPFFGIDSGVEGMREAIQKAIGGPEKTFQYTSGAFSWDVLVNAETLAKHVADYPDRAAYIPLLPETLLDPYEIWMAFERHKGTGQVVLRQRIIKAIATGDRKGMLVITNVVKGVMEAWTMIPTSKMNYLNNQRAGKLIWKRQDSLTLPE